MMRVLLKQLLGERKKKGGMQKKKKKITTFYKIIQFKIECTLENFKMISVFGCIDLC